MAVRYFECSVCLESKSDDRPHTIGEHQVCLECAKGEIVPLFENAVKYEYHHPPRFGNVPIDVLGFRDLLTPAFLEQYDAREEEYRTKVSDRVYCTHTILKTEANDTAPLNAMDVDVADQSGLERCNAFLGSKRNALDPSDRIFLCHQCTGMVCPCGEPLIDPDSIHRCATFTESNDNAAFIGLERGRKLQVCPHCERKIELSEACNEISCPCGGGTFCYRCGATTVDDPAHFAPGRCVRWGTGENPRAHHFDQVLRTPESYTTEEWNEAVHNARLDEMAHPTHSLPDEPLTNFDRNLLLILDRNDVRRMLTALRQHLDIDHSEGVVWRHETVLLLSTVEASIGMLLSGAHAPSIEFPDYIRTLEAYSDTIEEKMTLVPAEYIDSQGNLFEIVPSVVAQMQLLISEMLGEVEWSRYMIPF